MPIIPVYVDDELFERMMRDTHTNWSRVSRVACKKLCDERDAREREDAKRRKANSRKAAAEKWFKLPA